jgi:hypothetical protein
MGSPGAGSIPLGRQIRGNFSSNPCAERVNTNRHLYPPNLPTRPHPVGLVVTPTKGLANNIVRIHHFHVPDSYRFLPGP